ncbi:hypothetical protein PWT90_07433 [Aphanocladium album]|nr:hypothetical protein PWT90_07433 [Aphanocladium album]
MLASTPTASPRANPLQPILPKPPTQQPAPSRYMVTFSQLCPVTGEQHSFTLAREDLLSAKTLEGICYSIRWSNSIGSAGICAARSRALMELIYKVIEWERGLLEEHPLLPDAGSCVANKKQRQK